MTNTNRYALAGLLVAGGALLLSPTAAYACEKCFGAAGDSPTVQGISIAMLVLLTMTGVVWGGIMMFFTKVEKRSQMLASGELVVTDEGRVVSPALVDPAAYDRVLNTLLDKINREGFNSLTRQEKALLQEMTNGAA